MQSGVAKSLMLLSPTRLEANLNKGTVLFDYVFCLSLPHNDSLRHVRAWMKLRFERSKIHTDPDQVVAEIFPGS